MLLIPPRVAVDLSHSAANPVQPRSTIVVDLRPPPDDLAALQKPKTRYNTRLAGRRGVVVTEATTTEEVRAWCELMAITAARDSFTAYSSDYYLDAWQSLRAAARGALFLARHEGRLLAGILVSVFGPEAVYLFGASGNDDRHLMPNNLLQWEAMLWARARGATRYDMWGIPDTEAPDEPLRGVARFKEGWGGAVVRYAGAFDRVYRPRAYTAPRPAARRLPAVLRERLFVIGSRAAKDHPGGEGENRSGGEDQRHRSGDTPG
ncbi:MAG: hypothetical protein NVSMB65_04170 [Chloroflexota bacterium]